MKNVEITIDGKAYPCRQTMGAMLRFKRETGREVTEMEMSSFSDLCTFLWCCVVSACKADGVEFGMSLLDFADSISPDDMNGWAATLNDGGEAEGDGDEKKSGR